MPLSTDANERLYDTLADAIDRVGPDHEALFLTKLALLLANRLGDAEAVNTALASALREICPPA